MKHNGGEIVLVDWDARDYGGWQIEVPKHTTIGWWQRRRLSKAVKAWRQWKLAADLTKAALETA